MLVVGTPRLESRVRTEGPGRRPDPGQRRQHGLHSIGLVAPETLLDVPTIPEPFVSMESPDLAAPTRLAGLAPCSDQMFIC